MSRKPKPLSLRAYARHRKDFGLAGGTLNAVQVAIKSGRLSACLTSDGRQISDHHVADVEWAATTDASRVPGSGRTGGRAAPADLQAARARRESALAEMAEIELALMKDEYVPAEEARAFMEDKFTVVKTRLLALPTKLRQRDSSFTRQHLAQVDDLIREVLEELADEVDDEDEPIEDEP